MSAFYAKNVPPFERALRIAISAAIVLYALFALTGVWRPLAAASGIGFALTGVIGFCPACALVGRKLKPRT